MSAIESGTEDDRGFGEQLVRVEIDGSPFGADLAKQLAVHRETLGGTLLIDTMLAMAKGLEGIAYPPQNAAAAQQLARLVDHHATNVHRAVLFYMLLDVPESMTPRTGPIASFYAQDSGLPVPFRELVTGFSLADRLRFSEAIPHLCHPLVEDTYREQVMAGFLRAAGPHAHELVLQYVLAKSPRLSSAEQTAVYVEALCRSSVVHGLDYARQVSPDQQRDVLAQVVRTALVVDPKRNLWRLANATLSASETAVLHEVLEEAANDSPDARTASLARDVLLMQNLGSGSLQQARRIAAKSADAASGPVSRQDIASGLRIASGSA